MKPPPFAYSRPESADEVVSLLAEHGDEAKVLAGGQSLLPLLNFRLARPSVLVDLSAVEELKGLTWSGGSLGIGSMVRQREVELSEDVGRQCPVLPAAIAQIGHQQIRNRGTIGGSVAHADPAAELPAVLLALEATLSVRGPGTTRTIEAQQFFRGPFETALGSDELLMEIDVPISDARTSFLEYARRSGDFALAGVVAALSINDDRFVSAGTLAAFGVGGTARRLAAAEAAVLGRELTAPVIGEAAEAAATEIDPLTDIHADASYRRQLVRVLVARVLENLTHATRG